MLRFIVRISSSPLSQCWIKMPHKANEGSMTGLWIIMNLGALGGKNIYRAADNDQYWTEFDLIEC